MVIILTMPLLGVVSYSLKMFRKRGRRVNRLYIKVSSYLFWSHQITIAFESYSMICISVFINTTYVSNVFLIGLDDLSNFWRDN